MKFRHAITLGVAAIVLLLIILKLTPPNHPTLTIRNLRSTQEAAAPDGEPRLIEDQLRLPSFDPRLMAFSGKQRFRIPFTTHLVAPLGAKNGSLTYNARSFWSETQTENFQGFHTGDDLNGIGGQNSDLGDPVFAIGNGLVVYAGEPHPSWGKTILLAHRLPDGRIIQSLYAHLDKIRVSLDSIVATSDIIGTVGTAGGRYLAHLHFEAHEASGPNLGSAYVQHRTNRLNPTETVSRYPSPAPQLNLPSVSAIIEEIERSQISIPLTPGNHSL